MQAVGETVLLAAGNSKAIAEENYAVVAEASKIKEPDAEKLHVRVGAGGAKQPAFLPRRLLSSTRTFEKERMIDLAKLSFGAPAAERDSNKSIHLKPNNGTRGIRIN
jgi:hypothetical protein